MPRQIDLGFLAGTPEIGGLVTFYADRHTPGRLATVTRRCGTNDYDLIVQSRGIESAVMFLQIGGTPPDQAFFVFPRLATQKIITKRFGVCHELFTKAAEAWYDSLFTR